MTFQNILDCLYWIVLPIILWAASLFKENWKQMITRVETLEKQQQDIYTKEETRLLLQEIKVDMKEDLNEIKARLDKVIDKLMKQ